MPLTTRSSEWTDDAFWAGAAPAAWTTTPRERLVTGPSIEKSIAPLRSFVAEPMRFGRLFLAGDAAHIVPPTGAKGLNLAATDVKYLSSALVEYYRDRQRGRHRQLFRALPAAHLEGRALLVVVHLADAPFPRRWRRSSAKFQQAELDYLLTRRRRRRSVAENYVGLPLDFGD